jgi:nucleoside 2-deoxyribosyltransferase
MAFDKAQLENDEIQAKIDVLKSEENKNKAEAAYKEEFLRQRRIKLAEDIKLARIKVKQAQEELKIKASETTPSKTKSAGTGGTKSPKAASDNEPVKILNE